MGGVGSAAVCLLSYLKKNNIQMDNVTLVFLLNIKCYSGELTDAV